MGRLLWINWMCPKYNHRVFTSERGRQESEGRRCDDGSKIYSDAIAGWGP